MVAVKDGAAFRREAAGASAGAAEHVRDAPNRAKNAAMKWGPYRVRIVWSSSNVFEFRIISKAIPLWMKSGQTEVEPIGAPKPIENRNRKGWKWQNRRDAKRELEDLASLPAGAVAYTDWGIAEIDPGAGRSAAVD
jgi:hypothetical protein